MHKVIICMFHTQGVQNKALVLQGTGRLAVGITQWVVFHFVVVAGDLERVAGDSERVAGDLERVAGASSAYFVVPGRLAFNFVVSGDLERVAGDLRRMAGAGRDLLPCGVIEKFTTSPFKLKVVIQ